MSSRKTTLFYAVLLSVASLAVGMIIASRLDLSPPSSAQTLAVPPTNSAPISGPLSADTFRNIAKAATPFVVNIRTESRQPAQDLSQYFGGGGDDLLRRFFGEPGQPQSRQRPRDQTLVATGSGFIISRDGLILTNNHVVEGATKIEVSLYGEDDQVSYKARVIGRDPLSDSALIELVDKVDHALPEARFGDSSLVQPGDWVMAIGNPFNLAHTVSVGVISAIERPFPTAEGRSQEVLQTDAAINPGNSGGPLLNLRGEVIGINAAIYGSNASEGNIGIGFAIPINIVRDLLPQLKTGKVTRGRIGVQVTPVSLDALQEFGLKERRGALVVSVEAAGPAGHAGMEPGDVILEFSGKPVKDSSDLVQMVVATKPGSVVPVKVLRDKQERTLSLKVDELNLEAESSRSASAGGGSDSTTGFGLTLGNLTADQARRLRMPSGSSGALVTDVDETGPAARADVRPGDVVLEVNRRPVSSAADASQELQRVASGRTAFLLVWRQGQEIFLTIRKD
jgi:serine protease Do